jgi:hypothetical protein
MAESMIVPATLAFEELERLVRHLGDELAFFRRRALEAERRLKEVTPSDAAVTERETVQALEARAAGRGRRADARDGRPDAVPPAATGG